MSGKPNGIELLQSDTPARILSRSPHPYHRRQSDLAHPAETNGLNTPAVSSPLRASQSTDDDASDDVTRRFRRYQETPSSTTSDSGTEADDEHYLKGLPAPRFKARKGLRGADTRTPSPLLSPSLLDGEDGKSHRAFKRTVSTSRLMTAEEIRIAREKLERKRRVECIRRTTEVILLGAVGRILLSNPAIDQSFQQWKPVILSHAVTIGCLMVLYPIRLLYKVSSSSSTGGRRLRLPVEFDPAPLLYPTLIPIYVALALCQANPSNMLPNLVLSLAALPTQLVPAFSGLIGYNPLHWMISMVPLFYASGSLHGASYPAIGAHLHDTVFNDQLALIFPLHQALCHTLQYLTTTSLLPAELQLLSIALINLLLLAQSPQATILKILLWGGGMGLLITCSHVLRWNVALARVPKWRFRRAPEQTTKTVPWSQRLREFVSKDDMAFTLKQTPSRPSYHASTLSNEDSDVRAAENHIDPHDIQYPLSTTSLKPSLPRTGNGTAISRHDFSPISHPRPSPRRHTLPSLTLIPPKSRTTTFSGRRKRSASSTLSSFLHLTAYQATLHKWGYALYIYIAIILLILVPIRLYIQHYALDGHEPIGWALGYLFGDLPWLRFQVVLNSLEDWICLPPRSFVSSLIPRPGFSLAHIGTPGFAEHLRLHVFGASNTRLLLATYWLTILLLGLLTVFSLTILEVDTRRKVFHFTIVFMLLPTIFIDPPFVFLALSLVLAIFLLLDLIRAGQVVPVSKPIARFLQPFVDGRDLRGPVVVSHVFLLVGCGVGVWLGVAGVAGVDAHEMWDGGKEAAEGCGNGWELPGGKRGVDMVAGVVCVGLGDAAASLIGRRYGRRKWLWTGGKSLEGSVAFALAVIAGLAFAKSWLWAGGWNASYAEAGEGWRVVAGKVGIAAAAASFTEAVLTGGNDNVVVPVVLWLCVRGLGI